MKKTLSFLPLFFIWNYTIILTSIDGLINYHLVINDISLHVNFKSNYIINETLQKDKYRQICAQEIFRRKYVIIMHVTIILKLAFTTNAR